MYKPKYLYKKKDNKQNNINEQFKKNALRSESFGGKRFLGLTKNGGEVWVSYVLSRDTYDLSISLTHNLSNLLEEGAVLAQASPIEIDKKTKKPKEGVADGYYYDDKGTVYKVEKGKPKIVKVK